MSTNLLVGSSASSPSRKQLCFGVGAYVVAHFLMATNPISFLPALGRRIVLHPAECHCYVAVAAVSGDYFVVHLLRHPAAGTASFTNWTERHRPAPTPCPHSPPVCSIGHWKNLALDVLCLAGLALAVCAFS